MQNFSWRKSHKYPGEKLPETTPCVLSQVWRPRSMWHFHQEEACMSIHRNHQELAKHETERVIYRDYWLIFSCCAMNTSAVSATSRHPWSMMSECPRSGISRNSVAAGLFFCKL